MLVAESFLLIFAHEVRLVSKKLNFTLASFRLHCITYTRLNNLVFQIYLFN